MKISITNKALALTLIPALLTASFGYFTNVAEAAALANVSDTLSSQTTSAAANHTLIFRTPTGAADNTDTITIDFASGFNMNSIAFDDVDLAHSAGAQANCTAPTYINEETLAATPTGSAWGAALSGQVLTLTAPSDGVGTSSVATNACVRLRIGTNAVVGVTGNTQILNPGSSNTYTIGIAGTFGDVGSTTVSILTDDEVDISANVAQSLTFSISDTTIGFGTLSASGARFATGDTTGTSTEAEAHNLIVGTNAANGYTMTASGTTLTCASCGGAVIDSIGSSNLASSIGTEQFGLRLNASGGTGAVSVPYAAAGFAFDSAAFPDSIATAAGASANTTYSVRYLTNIAANTEAGTYNSAITYVATANY